MGDTPNMSNVQETPVQEEPNQIQPTDHCDTSEAEAIPLPPPGITIPPVNEATPTDERTPRTSTPTGLRDFEGRRLYFANVCATVSPHALHCIFRSYGPIRTFHYDATLHYGFVVYVEREQALLARYGIDGLILGSRAIRVYYPPFKPRHPTRYCYNCREMGHFIQSCPYTPCNNWEYNYAQIYNQGQPVIDQMNHPSAPMMQHFTGHIMQPTSHFMYPTVPVTTIPGQPPGSATLMYQPGWPGPHPCATNIPFVPQFTGPVPQPITSIHSPLTPMTPHLNPAVQQQQMHQFMNQVQHPMQPSLAQNQAHVQQPQPVLPVPSMIPVNPVMPPPQHQMQTSMNNPVAPPAPALAPNMPPSTSYPLHPNINAMIKEQATSILQQHITPIVQQVVSQIMQDPTFGNLQQSMMQQNMDPPTLQSSSYTVNEDHDSASVQSGSMTMQHGSYTAMEEPPRNATMPQNIMAQIMQNLPVQDSDQEYMDLGKMMQFAAQTLLQDQYEQRNEDSYVKESCSRSRCAHEIEEEVSLRPSNQRSPPVSCCPVHNTPLTRVPKPANTIAQQVTATTTTTIHNESTTTPRQQSQQYIGETIPPADQEFQTRTSSSTESAHLNTTEPPIQSTDNQYYPYQPPFSLPSSIFFTLPPIVVNITSPGPFMTPTGSTSEPKATFPPPYDTLPKNIPDSYDFMQYSERNLRDFEEVVHDDEQNYVENERDLRDQQSNTVSNRPSEVQSKSVGCSPRPSSKSPPIPSTSKTNQVGQKTIKTEVHVEIHEQTSQISEREKQRQDRLKLQAMLMDETEQDTFGGTDDAIVPAAVIPTEVESIGEKKLMYSELVSNMNNSCSEIENLFAHLTPLVGNPLVKKCLDQIRTRSEAEIMKLSQLLLHMLVDKDAQADKEEILKLSNDLLKYANQKQPSTSSAEPVCEGAVGGIKSPDEIHESSHSECDSRKDDSDEGNNKRKTNWKKNKKRRR